MNLIATRTNITVSEVISNVSAEGPASRPNVRLALDVTSLTGTAPTLDASIEFSAGGQNFVFNPAEAFAQLTGAGKETIVVENCPQNFDIRLTFGGTVTDCDLQVFGERV